MKHLLLSVAVAAVTLPAFAQDAATPAPDPQQAPLAVPDAGEAAENAAAAAESAARDAMDAAEDAARAAGAAAETGARAVEDAVTGVVDPAPGAETEMAPAGDDTAMPAATGDAAPDEAPALAPAETAEAMPADGAVVAPDVNAPAISEANPGTLGSWVLERRIYTTNQPAGTEWTDIASEDVPPGWEQIAKVDDIVLDDSGQLVGYIADIGGFLGIGAKQVLLGADAIHLATFDNGSAFATNFTKEELEALPDFNKATVRD